MQKILYFFSWLTIIIAIGLVILGSVWLLYPYKIIDFSNLPQEVTNKTVNPGEHIRFKIAYCKYQDMKSEVTVSFVDGFIYNTPTIPFNLLEGCHSDIFSVYVPKAIPPGVYSVQILYRHHPNPIRAIDTITITEKFTVTE